MMRNVALKRALKSTVFRPLSLLNKLIPKDDNIILLYTGNLRLGSNLRVLYRFLLENGYEEKYKIVCSVESEEYIDPDIPQGVTFITKKQAIKAFLRAKHVFYSTGQIPIKPSREQVVIHMTHGTCPYKTLGKLTKINNGDEFFFSYICASSEYYVPIVAKEYDCPEESVFVSSEPAADALLRPLKEDYHFHNKFKKVLLWLPTFRQSDYLGYSNSANQDLLLVFKPEDYQQLNERLKQSDTLLIVKLHSVQTLTSYEKQHFSNLWIMPNDEMRDLGYDLYQLMLQSDALIGDYSSASLQYLLLDRPLAYVIPDIEDYAEQRGFVFDKPEDYMPGPKIKTKQQFYDFLDELDSGEDPYRGERERVRKIIHKYTDGKSCERLMELSGLR